MGTPVSIHDVTVRVGARALVEHASLEIGAGETHAFIGPSGAGKTTLLRAIAGLIRVDSGSISLGNRVVATAESNVPAEERRVGFVFQGHGLWPHLTVAGHLNFVLNCAGVSGAEAKTRIESVLSDVGLLEHAARKPDTLSGGERQRLAIARAVVTEPALLLLDEPTASLDPITADEVRECIRTLARRTGSTVLLVTHDQREAFALARAASIMSQGRLLQTGTPDALWNHPVSATVARFLGEASLLPGRVRGGRSVETVLGILEMSDVPRGERVEVVLRPDDIVLDVIEGVSAEVVSSWFREGKHRVTLRIGQTTVLANAPNPMKVGDVVRVGVRGPCPAVAGAQPS